MQEIKGVKETKKIHLFDVPYPFEPFVIRFQNEEVGYGNKDHIVFSKRIPLDFLVLLLRNEKREIKVLYGDTGFQHLIRALKDYFSGKITREEFLSFFYFTQGLYTSVDSLEALWRFFFYSKESLETWIRLRQKITKNY